MRLTRGILVGTLTGDRQVLRWGWPPLALVPKVLAERLAGERVPEWLGELLDGSRTSLKALDVGAWERLPHNEEVRVRAASYVLDLVANHAPKLEDVRIGRPLTLSLHPLGLGRWPARARNAFLRSGIATDPGRLATITFGQLLDIPAVGIRTAMDIIALLELYQVDSASNHEDAPEDGSNLPIATIDTAPFARWGKPDAPLLPRTLRRAFATETLPAWLLQDLHLPPDATAVALDSSVWRHLESLRPRVEHFVLGLMTYRMEEIRPIQVMEGTWPGHIPPEAVPWPTRVRNALGRADLLDPSHLERLKYGDLLALPAMGVKSVLEFAVMADTLAGAMPVSVLDEATRQDLLAATEEEWAERVRADDPRFRDVAPPHLGSLSHLFEEALNSPAGPRAQAAADALPAIRARVAEIAEEPIDIALVRLLRSLVASDRQAAIIVARMGWREGGPRTLQEVGDEFSLTRERIRQIVTKVLDRVGQTYLPQIERAIELLTERAPISVDEAARLLVKKGLATIHLAPVALQTAAELLGYEVTYHIDSGEGRTAYVLAEGLTGIGPIFAAARRGAGRVGVSNIEEVHAALEADGHDFSTDAIARVLGSSPKVEFLDQEWFWMPHIPPDRNRLRNVTQRMLSVTPRLDLPTIRQGVRRRYRFMQIDLVPPTDILAAFYSAHPEFVAHPDATVEATIPLDYRDVLGDAERTFVEVLRGSSTGLMDRLELEEAVTGRGIALATFAVFTTYSPILDHPAMNVWCLRGHRVDPAQLEALRAVIATRPRHRRVLDHGWDEDGALRLTVVVGTLSSPVIGIPASISRYVAGRRFAARTREGIPAGVIAVDDSGTTSWGYRPFLHRRGAEIGDTLTLRFDLAAEQVTLTLGDEFAPDDSE
jgi:hypothetical protein